MKCKRNNLHARAYCALKCKSSDCNIVCNVVENMLYYGVDLLSNNICYFCVEKK